jgi:hypothetical protein
MVGVLGVCRGLVGGKSRIAGGRDALMGMAKIFR